MTPQKFKDTILQWIKDNGVDIGDRKVRCFNSPRYGVEVRIYNEPIEYQNTRSSFRETSRDDNTRYGTRGIHSRMIATYTHFNLEDWQSHDKEEREFALQVLKDSI